MKRIRKRLTYANVMSSLAVFLVIGGTSAFAASQLGKNSVGTKQLKKNAVTSAKVKNNSLKAVDFKSGQLPRGETGPKGEKGEKGAKGDKGDKGDKGTNGVTKIEEVVGSGVKIAASNQGQAIAECPVGKIATGGGAFDIGNSSAYIYQSGPRPVSSTGTTPTGWEVFYKTAGSEIEAIAYVLCATP